MSAPWRVQDDVLGAGEDLDLAVAAPARVGVAAVEGVHGEVHGVAAAVVAPAAEVVRQDALAGLPWFPTRSACNLLQKRCLENPPNRVSDIVSLVPNQTPANAEHRLRTGLD